MADKTHIEWTDATWQVVTGCSVVSPGCTNCYAMRLAGTRLQHHPSRAGLTQETKAGPVWNGEVRFNEQWLDQPLKWIKPRRIFVCAHGDLFHEAVPDEWIDHVFAVMALCPQHTFQILTKRAKRMREYFEVKDSNDDPDAVHQRILAAAGDPKFHGTIVRYNRLRDLCEASDSPLPLPNVWLGVSVEDQARYNERAPDLAATPAAKRFLSYEPALGSIDILLGGDGEEPWAASFDWLISGGESGPNARKSPRSWFQSVRDQCRTAGIYYFHKQNGEWVDADELLAVAIRNGHGIPLGYSDGPLNFEQAQWLAARCGAKRYEHQSDGTTMIRVGKKAAGALLDGREHREFPA